MKKRTNGRCDFGIPLCIRVDNAVKIIIIKCGIIRKYSSHRHLMTANFIYLIVQVNNKESLGEEN